MGKLKVLSEEERKLANRMHKDGHLIREIAKKLKTQPSNIQESLMNEERTSYLKAINSSELPALDAQADQPSYIERIRGSKIVKRIKVDKRGYAE